MLEENMIESPSIKSFCELIYQQSKGREILFWGEINISIQSCYQRLYNIKINKRTTVNSEICNNEDIILFSTLINKNNEYFIFVPSLPEEEKHLSTLFKNGFASFKDFIFYKPNPLRVPKGDYSVNKYIDYHGNEFVGVVGDNVITFTGYNAKATFSNSTSITKSNFTLNNFAVLNIKDNSVIKENNIFILKYYGNFTLGEKCTLYHSSEYIADLDTQITIGAETTIGHLSNIIATCGGIIEIGKDCMFSSYVILYVGDGHPIFDIKTGLRTNVSAEKRQFIKTGKHVWFGKRCMVISNSNIGEGCIIGAQSTVKGNFPNNCILAGNIARIIKKDMAWQDLLMQPIYLNVNIIL